MTKPFLNMLILLSLAACGEAPALLPPPLPDLGGAAVSRTPTVRAFVRYEGQIAAQGNDTGQPNQVERGGIMGVYNVTLPGMDPLRGSMLVTPLTLGSILCVVGPTGGTVQVICSVPATQVPADSSFSLIYVQ